MPKNKESFISEKMEIPARIQLPRDTEVTPELIKSLVKIHEKGLERYKTLQYYYDGGAIILKRQKPSHKSNNRLVFPYPSYIVDLLLGMHLGKPVSYFVADEYKEIFSKVQDILDLNDEQDENAELGKIAGIKGRAYEIVYVDEEANIAFNEVQPENIILVFDDKIKPEPWLGIYITDYVTAENIGKDTKDKRYTVYTDDTITDYISEGGELKVEEAPRQNQFGEVPIVEFLNNNETIGDFERVISLIDAMNLSQSDTSNDLEEFTDAILLLYGILDTDDEDIRQLLEDKVMLLDSSEGSKQGAEWLIKNTNDTTLENHKTRLDRAIFKFAKVPDLSDENFAGNTSGEAMKFKLFGTDQVIAQKQNKFKTGLQTRLRLILKGLNILTGDSFDYRDIAISFFDNKPYNELDNIQAVKTALDAGLSKQYALSKLKDLDDIAKEMQREEEEASAYADVFNFDKEVEENDQAKGLDKNSDKVSEDSQE